MTAHVLVLSLGPVQDFIAQARRTRDLWFGSHVLSELARACARSLAESGATLVFPALDRGEPELQTCHAPVRDDGRPPRAIANKLLVVVPAGRDPAAIAEAARDTVQAHWVEWAGEVRQRVGSLIDPTAEAAWDEQVATALEVVAAWAPIGAEGYAGARRAAERALAARKNLRDFRPWRAQRGDVYKSSLDGGRETVLVWPRTGEAARLARRFRIVGREELDAVGLVKRCGGEPEQFVPVTNVALAAWLDERSARQPTALKTLESACREAGVGRVARDLRCARSFGHDAQVFLAERLRRLLEEEAEVEGVDRERFGSVLYEAMRGASEPFPYVACVAADGDRVGGALDGLGSPDAHRDFSRRLARFAEEARDVVERRHRGCLIYAGGDDVLALVTLPDAVACASELHATFGRHMAGLEAPPTLSVGVGVGHVLAGLGELLALARDAERLAKGDHLPAEERRDALALVVDKRSGGRAAWRARWAEEPAARLADDRELIGGLDPALSIKKIHELARLLRRLPSPGAAGDDPTWAETLRAEAGRILGRSRVGLGDAPAQPLAGRLGLSDEPSYAAQHRALARLVDRLLVVRTLRRADPTRAPEEALA